MIGEQLYKIDKHGFPTECIIAYFDEGDNLLTEVDDDVVREIIPQGFYRPRWDGSAWIEDMTQDEIDEAYRQQPKEPTELDFLGHEVVSLKIENMQKDIEITTLGQELASIKLQLLQGGM